MEKHILYPEENYCSYKISKLFYDIGMNLPKKLCKKTYLVSDVNGNYVIQDTDRKVGVIAPTHAIAIEWLRINFNLQIHLIPQWEFKNKLPYCFYYVGLTFINKTNIVDMHLSKNGEHKIKYDTPYDAIEDILEYITENFNDIVPTKKQTQLTTETLQEFFENEEFLVHLYEQDNIQCVELEKWTDQGVDMIINLNPFTKEQFIEYVNEFNIDENIELHRQGSDYKNAFTISESLKDFTDFHNMLKDVVIKLNKLN